MKKINLILCACAVALAGLMISCKNGNVDKIDVTQTTTRYIYKVNGTITSIQKSGTTSATTTVETKYTVTDVLANQRLYNSYGGSYTEATISEKTDEAYDTNITGYDIDFSGGNSSATKTTTPASGTATVEVKDYVSGSSLPSLSIAEIDGEYYINYDYAWVNVDDNFDGFVGDDEFTFKYEGASANGWLDQDDKDANVVSSYSTSFDLTFTLVGEE